MTASSPKGETSRSPRLGGHAQGSSLLTARLAAKAAWGEWSCGYGKKLFKDDISWIYLFPPPRNEPLVFTGLAAKFHYQINLKMGSRFFHPQVLGGSLQGSGPHGRHVNCATSKGNRYQWFSPEDEFDQKPFWLTIVYDITRSLRSLALFLVEQPSQLKYIEWPSIENTAKTAALTLVLVAVLIVSLASVDSFLFYVLALLTRRSA